MHQVRELRGAAIGLLVLATMGLSGCQTAQAGHATNAAPPKRGADEEIWAIRCITLTGPDRFKRADSYAAALKHVKNLKPDLVQVLSDEDGTSVFYGRYTKTYDPAKGTDSYKPDNLHDLEAIRALKLEGSEVWPFILAAMEPLPGYEPAHPEWDLAQVKGYWSLQVAVFYNSEGFRSRRSAAEEYCRILREQGEEAYFHHGASQSSVCIGIYPKEAIAEVQRENPLAGRATLVTTIVDPKLQDAQKRFPITLHNGHKMYDIQRDPQTGEVKDRIPLPSLPVKLPAAQKQAEEPKAKGRP